MKSSHYLERESRFLIAFRIVSPLVIFIAIVFIDHRLEIFRDFEREALIIGFFVSVYFTFYLIDQWLKELGIDPISKLFNTATITKIIAKGLASKDSYSVLLVRIDHFEILSAQMPIIKSNELLAYVGKEIDRIVSKEAKAFLPAIGRYREDGFLIGVGCSEEEAFGLASQLVTKSQDWRFDGLDLEIHVALLDNQHISKVQEAISRLYKMVASIADSQRRVIRATLNNDEQKLLSSLTNAYRTKTMELWGMPVVRANGEIAAFSTTVRITKDGELLPQSYFWPFVERIGLEKELIVAICEMISQIKQYDVPFLLSLRDTTLLDSELAMTLSSMSELLKERMIIEVISSGMVRSYELGKLLGAWHEQGWRFALGNFTPKEELVRLATYPEIGWVILHPA
ncbi:MAG: hypothetical protein K6347_08260, partial [Campylobacterales bacterium]